MTVKYMPQRQCLGCNERKEKSQLVRIVKLPDGEIKFDRSGKSDGRGAYICACVECLEKAFTKRSLNRAFRTNVPSEVYERLKEEITFER